MAFLNFSSLERLRLLLEDNVFWYVKLSLWHVVKFVD